MRFNFFTTYAKKLKEINFFRSIFLLEPCVEMASFGERQLAKFGWECGDGLGKNKQGISKAPNLTKKNDQTGIGLETNRSEQFFPWWDAIYNKTASSIEDVSIEQTQINLSDDGCKKEKKKKKSTKRSHTSDPAKKDLKSKRNSEKNNAFTPINVDDLSKWTHSVTDADLMRACQGRTAYKGSRRR